MVFPLAKLGYLAIKQISKPLIQAIKRNAKTNAFLRNYILLPPAQSYHWWETTFKMRLLGIGKVKEVKPLNEEMAVEQAAELLGEVLIYMVAAGTILFEYRRQMKKDQSKEDYQNLRLRELESQVKDMEIQMAEQSAVLRSIERRLGTFTIPKSLPKTIKDSSSSSVLQVAKT